MGAGSLLLPFATGAGVLVVLLLTNHVEDTLGVFDLEYPVFFGVFVDFHRV